MCADYTIGKYRVGFGLVFYEGGKRRRYSLDGKNARAAALEAPGVYADLTRPKGKKVSELWAAYAGEMQGRAIIGTMVHTWKALKDRFGNLEGDNISIEDCRAHVEERRKVGIKEWTIYTELGHLRMVLSWAQKRKLCSASYIERPPQPKPKEHHLTREQCFALINAATTPHVRLFLILALGTGARNAALLELTWDRCDFERGIIDLRNPQITTPHKGRAIVPMTRTVRAALLEAKEGALSDHVIEWAGAPVDSVKRGVRSSAAKAKVGNVSPHMLRHSVAVHMAEDGIPMEEIAQFLGHEDVNVTRRVYARFSPSHLRKAAESLEYNNLAPVKRRKVQ